MYVRAQTLKPKWERLWDVPFARAVVLGLKHNLDAMEAVHQKHKQALNAEMQLKMQMMEKMDKDRSMVKAQVSAIEADVLAELQKARRR